MLASRPLMISLILTFLLLHSANAQSTRFGDAVYRYSQSTKGRSLSGGSVTLPHNMKAARSREDSKEQSQQYPFRPDVGAQGPGADYGVVNSGSYSPAPKPPPYGPNDPGIDPGYPNSGQGGYPDGSFQPQPAYPAYPDNSQSGYPAYPANPQPGYPEGNRDMLEPAYTTPGFPGQQPPDQTDGYPQPTTPDYGVPKTDGYPAPTTPDYGVPKTDGYPAPTTPDYGVPNTDGYPAPTTPDYGVPKTDGYPAATTPDYGVPKTTPGYPTEPPYPTPGPTPSAKPTTEATTEKPTTEKVTTEKPTTEKVTTEKPTTEKAPTTTTEKTTPKPTTTTERTTPAPTTTTTEKKTTTTTTPVPTTTTERTTPTTTMTTPTTTSSKPTGSNVPNRIRGKPHVICEADGIVFTAKTFFGFVGEVFARDRKSDPQCHGTFDGTEDEIRIRFPYKECGKEIAGARPGESMYSVEVIVQYEQPDGTSTIQSYLTRCLNQRIRYETEEIPRRIEEALEELDLVPIKVEKKAKIPKCVMKIVPEEEEEQHHYGPSDKKAIQSSTIGQKLKIEWSLDPPSEAYGFLVKNCTVKDHLSGAEYLVIDEYGCSTDINILAHPHYDTYHDLAIVHWHAFKVPDNAQLSIRCGFTICSEIEDDEGTDSCSEIPTPPFCPDLVTAPFNTLLFDFETNFLARRQLDELRVEADICILDEKTGKIPDFCHSRRHSPAVTEASDSKQQKRNVCLSKLIFSALLSFTVLCFLVSSVIFLSCTVACARRERMLRAGPHVEGGSECSSSYYDSIASGRLSKANSRTGDSRWSCR